MPRTKLQEIKPDKVKLLIRGQMLTYGVSIKDLTSYKIFSKPSDEWTLGDIKKWSKDLHIPIAELRDAITY